MEYDRWMIVIFVWWLIKFIWIFYSFSALVLYSWNLIYFNVLSKFEKNWYICNKIDWKYNFNNLKAKIEIINIFGAIFVFFG